MYNKKKSTKDNKKFVYWNIEDQPIEFPKKIRAVYEKNYKLNRVRFTNWIDKFNLKNREDIDWWMTLPPTRDPYKSQLLNYISAIDTLKKISPKNLKIYTNSDTKFNLLSKSFKKFSKKVKVKNKEQFKFLSIYLGYFKSIIFQLIIFIYINCFIKKKIITGKNLTIIDIFVTNDAKQNANFYPPFQNKKKEILFVPTFIQTFNYFKLFKIIHTISKNNNYLFKEHNLSIADLFYSFFHIFRRKKFLKLKFFYKNFDLSEIVHEEIKNFNDFNSIFIGLLNYKFFKNLKIKKVKINKTINWFENQIIDKGWNLGFRKFFKEAEENSLGIQDFGKHYNMINNSPSYAESKAKVTPKKITVISKIYLNMTKEFCKRQKVDLGNSWRFKDMKKNSFKVSRKRKKILLVLCGVYEIDKILIDLIYKTCLENKKLIINIKAHPILNIRKMIKKDLPKNIIIKKERLQDLLSKTKTVITSGPSSTILESSSNGNFLILPNIEAGTKMNTLRHKLLLKNYKLINNSKELFRSIKLFNNR